MHTTNGSRPNTLAALAVTMLLALARSATAQAPDFDAVAWAPLACQADEPTGDESPSAVDLVGDASHRAAYFAHDASYMYFRYRVDGDPAGSGGFASYAWNALMQVPSGNPFQYQYELSLDGKSDTVEVWANTSASNIDFSPLFNDPAESNLFSTSAGTMPLARHGVANDGSAFGGNADYFVDVAFPVSALVDAGTIASAADLDTTLFFPATATNANNYNKGHLSCPFSPNAALAIDKSVTPAVVPANAVTPIAYTIAVRNDGPALARGVVIDDPMLPPYLSNKSVSVAADDASVTWTVIGTNPLEVRVPDLPIGKTVTVTLTADASPDCNDNGFTNVATAFATNAPSVSDDAILAVNFVAGGCAPCTSDGDCDDANACSTDACVAGACTSTSNPGCTACVVDADCADDGDTCTTESCVAGVCTVSPTCTSGCVVDADCDDADPCTTDSCNAGTCAVLVDPTCGACATDADCNDGDACTTDACLAGACVASPLPSCSSNPPETCDDGIDNDGDGLVDCSDGDCADFPGCQTAEVCGDCLDNDGDGLVDYQDPDCCATPHVLDVRRMMLRPAPKHAAAKRFRLKVRNTGFSPESVDPRVAGATLQVSDAEGTILCQPIPASAWTHRGKRAYRFKDVTGSVAGGLKRARFLMKRDGKVPFRALGKAMILRKTSGHDVQVTIGIGGQCSQTTTELRAKGDKMLVP
jgi:uncharacterized repeat protein (TIGR01451 family)